MKIEDLLPISSSMQILFVDDEKEFRESTLFFLGDLFQQVDVAQNGIDALALYKANKYDIVITDLSMPLLDGIGLIKKIQILNPAQAILVVSAYNEATHLLECIHLGVTGYVLKPLNFDELVSSIYKVALFSKNELAKQSYKKELEFSLEEQKMMLEKNYQEMQQLLTLDKVTQLPNLVMLHRMLDQIPSTQAVTLILCNINHFSLINHSYGFDFGDKVLKKMGDFLRYALTAFHYDFGIFRYVSDEFVILLQEALEYPEEIVLHMQSLLKETPITENDGESIYLTMSCGIVSSEKPVMMLSLAQEALKEARYKGLPNQFCTYDKNKTYFKKSDFQFTWIKKLRSALEEERVIPWFQPIVDNQTEKIFSYECLARIKDEANKIILPALFIPAARQSGMMTNLTKAIVSKSFQTFSGTDTHFSINISYEDLLSPDFVEYLCYKQKQYAIRPKNVLLEILEDVVINEEEKSPIANFKILKDMGYQIALDDFGSDRSNFNRFASMGVDFLKIDGQFIRGIDHHIIHQSIVESIVHMAEHLDIKVIAEFVETKEEYEMVKSLGVHYSQGYYFYKPNFLPIYT